jgi:hypothetical protein
MPLSHKTVANPLRRLCLAVTTSVSTKSFTDRTLQRRVSTNVQTAVSSVLTSAWKETCVGVGVTHTSRVLTCVPTQVHPGTVQGVMALHGTWKHNNQGI